MEELTIKLIELMKIADNLSGVHTRVYEKNIFSSDYLRKIKRGEQSFGDTPENHKKVRELIKAYKEGIHEKTQGINI